MSIKVKVAALAAPLALLTLGGCAAGLPTQVSRFSALPAPDGQSFVIEAANEEDRGGLEFSRYAALVRQHLIEEGYRPASGRGDATLIVRLDYGVDNGQQRVVSRPDPFCAGYLGCSGFGFGRPYYSRFGFYGRRNPFYWGWNDPWYGGGASIDSYTVYQSYVDLDIRRASDGQAVFEGLAQARSRRNQLTVLVPNLVEALFTDFPGNNGETVRITVPDEETRQGRRR